MSLTPCAASQSRTRPVLVLSSVSHSLSRDSVYCLGLRLCLHPISSVSHTVYGFHFLTSIYSVSHTNPARCLYDESHSLFLDFFLLSMSHSPCSLSSVSRSVSLRSHEVILALPLSSVSHRLFLDFFFLSVSHNPCESVSSVSHSAVCASVSHVDSCSLSLLSLAQFLS